MKFGVAVASLFASAILFGTAANANTVWDFTFSGVNFNASGILITASTPNTAGSYDILSISGAITGNNIGTAQFSGGITGLVPNPNQPSMATFFNPSGDGRGWYYDNVAYASATSPAIALSPFVDYYGALFGFGANGFANLYSNNGVYFLSIDAPGSPSNMWDAGDQGVLTAVDPPSPVPGPIVGAGLPGIIFAGASMLVWWRRRGARAAMLAA